MNDKELLMSFVPTKMEVDQKTGDTEKSGDFSNIAEGLNEAVSKGSADAVKCEDLVTASVALKCCNSRRSNDPGNLAVTSKPPDAWATSESKTAGESPKWADSETFPVTVKSEEGDSGADGSNISVAENRWEELKGGVLDGREDPAKGGDAVNRLVAPKAGVGDRALLPDKVTVRRNPFDTEKAAEAEIREVAENGRDGVYVGVR
jgi:hypothetical protein